MSDDPRFPWLLLQRLPPPGVKALQALLAHYGDAAEILCAPPQVLRDSGASPAFCDALCGAAAFRQGAPAPRGRAAAAAECARRDLEWLESTQTQCIHWKHPAYPDLLRHIHAPPPVLYVRGAVELLNIPQLAMVGTRRASPDGRAIAREIAADLVCAGLGVNSGLARGIDSVGHRQTLAEGGHTVAVLGGALDRIYPREHLDLAMEIAARGALLSEFPPGTPPTRKSFPQRNRIISGLSLGVLVIEAALRSGSLITARHAREQNREVFAVPGALRNPMSEGCNRLIQQGAKLVLHTADILEELPEPFCSAARPKSVPHRSAPGKAASGRALAFSEMNAELRLLLESVGFAPTPAELAVARSRLDPGTVQAALNELEIRGWLERTPLGYVRSR